MIRISLVEDKAMKAVEIKELQVAVKQKLLHEGLNIRR